MLLLFTNHEHHNQDAVLAVTELLAALFLFRAGKKHGIFSCPASLSIGVELVSDEVQCPQRSFCRGPWFMSFAC
jgi:hypothetical protein